MQDHAGQQYLVAQFLEPDEHSEREFDGKRKPCLGRDHQRVIKECRNWKAPELIEVIYIVERGTVDPSGPETLIPERHQVDQRDFDLDHTLGPRTPRRDLRSFLVAPAPQPPIDRVCRARW